MQIDTMAEYVRRRLEHWGEEFALHRDCEYIGHKSKNMLAVLIEHRGDMPPRDVGFKPTEVDLEAMQIEDIVTEIARHAPAMGWCMRAYYCGIGRRKYERHEQAMCLLRRAGMRTVTRAQYLDLVRRGPERVHGALVGAARGE